jgi:hypothetical protein
VLALALLFGAFVAACQGCRGLNPPSGDPAPPDARATLRLYLLSTLAGALEPCGCSKDQLGGLDHLAAYISSQRDAAQASLVLAAGPLWFIDADKKEHSATQDRWKAEAMAAALGDMGLAAWAPGNNDWAHGGEAFADLAARSGAKPLGAGFAAPLGGSTVVTVGGVKVGILGVADPMNPAGAYPEGVKAPGEALALAKAEVKKLEEQGAELFIALAALPRGDALRIADAITTLDVLLIGRPYSGGAGNTEPSPAELVGSTLVVETANHGQSIAVVDIHLTSARPITLADAGGVKRAADVLQLTRRIRELENRINGWERGSAIDKKDIAARKSDLARLLKEREALEGEQPAPQGSFFRYRLEEVREGLGKDKDVAQHMLAHYKRVNAHNKKALADMTPPKAGDGEAHYLGIDACSDCHPEEREVWDKSGHAHAYKTLVDDFKEFNLECVGCHVTGYGKPGGSTVTHNATLQSVQCETCHGPGSLHAKTPEDPKLIVLAPDPKSCVKECHHPPHVEGFDPKIKMELVLGPGHGK